jgi:hypothetical protein
LENRGFLTGSSTCQEISAQFAQPTTARSHARLSHLGSKGKKEKEKPRPATLLFGSALRLVAALAAGMLGIDLAAAFRAAPALQLHDKTGARSDSHDDFFSKVECRAGDGIFPTGHIM